MKNIFAYLFIYFLSTGLLCAQIVITEIHYNNDANDDNDFIELYNNSGADIQMEGYYFEEGFTLIFPDFVLAADAYVVLAIDAPVFKEQYGIDAIQFAGTLNSGGEDLSLYTADSVLVDYVDFEDDGEWPHIADGFGTSLSLCDVNTDNEDPAKWQATSSGTPRDQGNGFLFATPGGPSTCASGPIVAAFNYKHHIIEGQGTTWIELLLTNGNGTPSTIDITVDPSSTADADEYEILQSTINFNGTSDTSIFVGIAPGTNDDVAEEIEKLVLKVNATTNVDRVITETIYVNLLDDDITPSNSLLIVGVFENDAPEPQEHEFGMELYALKAIPDLSKFTVGVAKNGDGTRGGEVQLPAVSLTAGQSYFISGTESRFINYFGFAPDYQNKSLWPNGDDCVELYENGVIIDTYGYPDIDGSDQFWEYNKGWAKRETMTNPDGANFNPFDWTYSGISLLNGATNEESISPYPIGSYMGPVVNSVDDPLADFDLSIFPNPVMHDLQLSFDPAKLDVDVLEVSIYNSAGQLMIQKAVTNGQSIISIDVSELAKGLYFAQSKTSKGKTTSRFVKR